MMGQSSMHARQDAGGEGECLLSLQESHCRPVRQLLFNMVDASCSNLFATVGGEQATVYDDMHMGDYIAVVLNFVNARTSHAAGQVGPFSLKLLDILRPVRCRVCMRCASCHWLLRPMHISLTGCGKPGYALRPAKQPTCGSCRASVTTKMVRGADAGNAYQRACKRWSGSALERCTYVAVVTLLQRLSFGLISARACMCQNA